MSGMISLDTLDEDILILVLSYLAVDDLLSLRQTCHRLHKTTHLRIVWRNACLYNILLKGFPFPSTSSNGSGEWALDGDGLSSRDLERYTRLASRLAGRWLATLSATTEKPPRQPWQQQQLVDSHDDAFPRVDALAQSISSSTSTIGLDMDTAPLSPNDPQQQLNWLPLTKETNFTTSSSTEITYVRFLPGRKERYILVVSKGIWSTLSLWEIEGPHLSSTSGASTPGEGARTLPRERASWSLKGGLFSRFVVNEDVTSEAVVAVSVYAEG
ncbi:hypothetical protein ONZ45_g19722 [Pleurotus djamor]|nr:hypothetical protein ONZ45_g19722 [Pleurotus djamor]